MSAWILSPNHIHYIVSCAVKVGMASTAIGPDMGRINADKLGTILHRENVKSVNCRYAEKNQPKPYRWDEGKVFEQAPFSIPQAFQAIACLDYQSCEHDGWKRSQARRLLLELSAHLGSLLASQTDGLQWAID